MPSPKLYTEADVRAMAPGADRVLGPGAIATPAALDVAHERGIRIVRGGPREAGARDARRDKFASLWEAMLAEDGNYTVSVKNGKAVVHRMTPDGPVKVGGT